MLKASQEITHQSRLVGCDRQVRQMIEDDSAIGPNLACILFQLPPSLRRNSGLLTRFIHLVADQLATADNPPRLAFEFRHPSWNAHETLHLLAELGCSMVIHDMARSGEWQWHENRLVAGNLSLTAEELLARPMPLLYLRFHGTTGKYAGRYGAAGLAPWASLARAAMARGIPVHAYFNNTQACAAVADALELGKLLE